MGDSDSNEQFELNGEPPAVSARAKARRITAETYQHKIRHYCELYRHGEKPLDRKTVERWIAKGRAAGNLPPLDDPTAMAAWWRVVVRRKVPEVFVSMEGEKKGAAAADADGEKAGEEAAGSEAAEASEILRKLRGQAKEMADRASTGFQAALERAHSAERLAWAEWQVALLDPDRFTQSQIDRRKKSWEDALDAMRKAELVAEKVLSRSDEWATWEEMERELAEAIPVIATGVRSLWTRVNTKVALPPGVFELVSPIFEKEVDSLFSELGEGDFAPKLELKAS